MERALYASNGDLVIASQKLSQQQNSSMEQNNTHYQQQQQHQQSNNLLSLANQIPPTKQSPMFNCSDNFSMKSYQSALLSSLNPNDISPTGYHNFNQQQQNSSHLNSSQSAFTPMLLKNNNQLQEHAIAAMKFNMSQFPAHKMNPFTTGYNGMTDIYNAFQQFPYFQFNAAQHLAAAATTSKPNVNHKISSMIMNTSNDGNTSNTGDNLTSSLSLDSSSSSSQNLNTASASSSPTSGGSARIKSINNSPSSSGSPTQSYTLSSLTADGNYAKSLSLTY